MNLETDFMYVYHSIYYINERRKHLPIISRYKKYCPMILVALREINYGLVTTTYTVMI